MKIRHTFFLALLILLSCKDDAPELTISEAEITGADYTFCECCTKQAFTISIEDDAHRFFYDELPEGSINLNETDVVFPVHVRIHWKKKERCIGDEILIKKISRITP